MNRTDKYLIFVVIYALGTFSSVFIANYITILIGLLFVIDKTTSLYNISLLILLAFQIFFLIIFELTTRLRDK